MAQRKELAEARPTKQLVKDLRTIVLRNANFKCFHDMTEEEQRDAGVDEGYCDSCPLTAFEPNDRLKSHWDLCGHDKCWYSK